MNKQEMKDLVTKAHHELFNLHDTTALDRYFSEDFRTLTTRCKWYFRFTSTGRRLPRYAT